MKNPNEIKYNFGKGYCKPMSPFKKYWRGGVGSELKPRSHIAEESWNAALGCAVERLSMYGVAMAAEILEILFEEDN